MSKLKYRSFDDERGYPPRFYRTPEEVRGEIYKIKERIKEVNESLNIRELLSYAGVRDSSYDIKTIDTLSESLQYAMDTLSELRELEDTLDKLKEEFLLVSEILK